MNIKADMHVHIDEDINIEDLKKILLQANAEKLGAVSLICYNSIKPYKTGGVFEQLKNSKEGISSYFKGKIITGVEMVCTCENMKSNNDFNYFAYRSDITLFDFKYKDLERFFNEEKLKLKWIDDFNNFKSKCKDIGIIIPDIENFTNDFHPLSFVTQWFDTFVDNVEEKQKYEKIFGIPINTASDITRNHITNPKGKLFYEQKLFPKVSDMLKIAKFSKAKVCISHPAHMSNDFDTSDYIETMHNFSCSNNAFQKIEFCGGEYMLNTNNEREIIYDTSKRLGILPLPESDMRIVDKMYYLGELSKEKVYYTPKPGFAIAKEIETGDGAIFINSKILDKFRNYSEADISHSLNELSM